MALLFARRLGETFTITYPDGEIRTIGCNDLTGTQCLVDGKARAMPCVLIGDVRIEAERKSNKQQIHFKIQAPADVKILRADAKLKEKRA